jgi:UDP-2-acetamido-3-amino-2,3-dideoxy-glucuronate N-acetyltransferase
MCLAAGGGRTRAAPLSEAMRWLFVVLPRGPIATESLLSAGVNRHSEQPRGGSAATPTVSAAAAASFRLHPHGLCESTAVGDGTRIWAFVHVLPGARIGSDCNICNGAFVEGGAVIGDRVTIKNHVSVWDRVTIEDDCFVGPNVVFTNDYRPRAHVKRSGDALVPTLVRRGTTIGANATIVCGVTLGEHSFVAAGSVVVRDVEPHAIVAGNPARRIGWACRCGERLDDDGMCGDCGERYAAPLTSSR